ncbi:MAG: B12-binding domain-containing radical SAM protein [Ignavibacteria bacterium]
MDILLTHAYFLCEDDAEQRVMKPYPTLGILYLSSYLKSRGYAVDVFDTTFSTRAALYRHIESTSPPVVGISINLMTRKSAVEVIRFCKRLGCLVVVGGPEVPHYAEEFLRCGADVAVIGEGELTLAELLAHLRRSGTSSLQAVAGIVYREQDGSIVHTPARALIEDLDALPNPDRAAIDMTRFLDTWKRHHGRSSLSLLCARGCPYTCAWCSRSVFGETHRRRSVQHVADEVELLVAEYHPDQLWYADDVFTINHRWLFALRDELKRRGISKPFECITRADRLNEDVIRALAEMGASRVWFGSESGSQRILDAMERRVSVQQIRGAAHLLKRYGIEAGLFVMLGYPGEELEDIDATIEHLKASQPDTFLTTIAYPIKGTPFYDDVRERIITNGEWSSASDRALEFRGRYPRRFYWFATRHLVNEVHLHRLVSNGQRKLVPLLSAFVKSKAARLGMYFTAQRRT